MATFAESLFEAERAYKVIDDELWRRVCRVIGKDWNKPEDLESLPWENITYDDYDLSIELQEAVPGFDLTPEQLAEIWKLGFVQMWICYKDGTEKYYKGA